MAEDALTVRPPLAPTKIAEEFGPVSRWLGTRYFDPVRFPQSATDELRGLSQKGFVVHVMRSTAWINFLYLDWALVKRGLPPVRTVVNLRPWMTRPFNLMQHSGEVLAQMTHARDVGGSGLIFMRESAFNTARGKETRHDPFPALVEMARTASAPIYVVPELLVWEKWQQSVTPSVFDRIFGSPEAPGFVHTVATFIRNYKRAQFRVGEKIDLVEFVRANSGSSTALLARKVRSALHHHLARETRAVFGPPRKSVERLIDEAMRDRQFQDAVHDIAKEKSKTVAVIEKEAQKNFHAIAARLSPSVVGITSPTLHLIFNRIYDGIEVDEVGLEKVMRAASQAPLVLTPSHKSHMDYLIMSYVLWERGYNVPLVAAGANLSFFPLGPFLRRAGAFFLRRSFKGDKLYTAVFKAYLKKLVHDGIHTEFFPEGGRSRTGKLLQPKLGLFTWLADAVFEGARNDLLFVPTSIDYEKVVEGASYSKELKGGEKKPEDIKALLSAPKVLTENYGRIHLTFDEPVSLAALMKERNVDPATATDEQKRSVVRALGHRVMYGISKVSTVTPHALLASALLAHRRRGISAREVTDRIGLLRQIVADLGSPLSKQLFDAPSSPVVLGPILDAIRSFASEGMVHIAQARDEPIYQVEDNRRPDMSFYKNTLLNLVAGRSIVSRALLTAPTGASLHETKDRALFLSRLWKFEFVYPVGKTFEDIFDETVKHLAQLGLIDRGPDSIRASPESHVRPLLQFMSELNRDYLESYLLVAQTAAELSGEVDRKEFLKRTRETGQVGILSGTIACSEALSKTTFETAVLFLVEQQFLVEKDKKLVPGTGSLKELVAQLQSFLPEA